MIPVQELGRQANSMLKW